MKPISDYHVHTSASGCCKQDYGVLDAWNQARSRGIELLGITDHDVPFKNQFLTSHGKMAEKEDGLFLGLEASIRNIKGKIQVSRANLDLLDYLLLSEHVHIMPGWTLLRKGKDNLKRNWWNDSQNQYLVEKFYDRHALMTRNALKRNEPDILAHPWRFPWHGGFLDVATIDAYEPVIKELGKLDVKVEFSRSIMSLLVQDLNGEWNAARDEEEHAPWKGNYSHEVLSPVPFFKLFFGRCRQEGIHFTLGSDAHRLEDIAAFPPLHDILDGVGLSWKDIAQDFIEK
ncbi:MAG: hypothetical protein ACTSUE_11080 [Promethearchaeota archaeon]